MDESAFTTQLQHLQARIIAGVPESYSDAAVPADWMVASDELGGLSVLAMLGQCRQFLAYPLQPGRLLPQRGFPAPQAKTVDDAGRGWFRRAIAEMTPELQASWLEMLARRGWMAHPFDWPLVRVPQDQPLPAFYDAWRGWSEHIGEEASVDQDFEAEDWNVLSAGEQRRLLRRLRRRDPAEGRALFATHATALPAAQRLSLLEILGEGLEAGDEGLLESLVTDRSEKVRQLAAQLRARLGLRSPLDPARLESLQEWFEIGRAGLIRRRDTVGFASLKNAVQRRTRDEQVTLLAWDELATALGRAPVELVHAWNWNDKDPPLPLLQCAAASAGRDVVLAWLELLLFERRDHGVDWLLPMLSARLDEPARISLAMRCLHEPSCIGSFRGLLELAGVPLGNLGERQLFGSLQWRALMAWLQTQDGHVLVANSSGAVEFHALACMLPMECAAAVLQAVGGHGFRAADPALDALRLNSNTPDVPLIEGSQR